MGFVWDEAKEAANLAKHALSLSLAERIDPATAIAVEDRRSAYGEPRFVIYANLDGRVHVVILSPRGGDVRVISLRKANRRETRRYDELRSAAGGPG